MIEQAKEVQETLRLPLRWRLLFLLLLSLSLLQAHWLWRQHVLLQGVSLQKVQQDGQLQTLQKRADASEQWATAQRGRDQQHAALYDSQLQEMAKQLAGQKKVLASLRGATMERGLWIKAEELLRLAQQQLTVFSDSAVALNLLREVDRLLSGVSDPRLSQLRHMIAEEMLSLRGDLSGDLSSSTDALYFELSAMKLAADSLPLSREAWFKEGLYRESFLRERSLQGGPSQDSVLRQVVVLQVSQPDAIIDKAEGEQQPDQRSAVDWLQRLPQLLGDLLRAMWRELQELIVVERQAIDGPALLPAAQQYYVRSHLKLLLSQAQLALLQREEEIYRASLSEARQWLGRHFLFDHAASVALMNRIEEVSTAAVSPAGDLSHVQLLLKEIVSARHLPANHIEREEKAPSTTGVAEAESFPAESLLEVSANSVEKTPVAIEAEPQPLLDLRLNTDAAALPSRPSVEFDDVEADNLEADRVDTSGLDEVLSEAQK